MKNKITKYTQINTNKPRLCTVKSVTKPNAENCKNCSSKRAYDCAQLSYTTTTEPLKLRPYGAIQMTILLLYYYYYRLNSTAAVSSSILLAPPHCDALWKTKTQNTQK